MTATITDRKFSDLKDKLRELFELDKSDLDFGIYRIMAAKNTEVTDFLDRQLKDVVRQTLLSHDAGTTAQVQAEIEKARAAAQAAGFNPDESPKVKELMMRIDSAGATSAADLEADIYNHLLAFFSRYYDEGDFISKRRYKGDIYSIPYSGEEVTLYWANKDQYYIKSGEWHKDYRFKVAGKTVRFKLVDATQETNNNKEPEDAKRRYILDTDNPIEETPAELTLNFQFRLPAEAEKSAAAEATEIFGGKYAASAGRTKGDEREQFCADAEKRAIAVMSTAWLRLVAQSGGAATETKPARTILGKHLDDFTAKNTFDYFIHKDLGGFLRRELDFYVKNEVVRLDDLENLPADHLERVQSKVKAIRTVAAKIIDFLSAVENFQKKIWLKKKLVLNANWLVTVDRIPAALRDAVAANEKQWAEWEALGFKPAAESQATLLTGPQWNTREYLDANDKLVVDTRLFDAEFKTQLLASDEVRAGANSIEDATTGLLINSENFQAMNLLKERFREQVKCVYIDPPYNTSENAFLYKNSYKHSSWLSMMANGLNLVPSLMPKYGVLIGAIDDTEYSNLKTLLMHVFGDANYVGTIAVEVNPAGQNIRPNVPARSHDYFHIFSKEIDAISMILRGLTPEERNQYKEKDSKGLFYWDNLRRRGGNSRPEDRPKQWFPLFVNGQKVRVPEMKWSDSSHKWIVNDLPNNGEVEIWPFDPKGEARIWRVNPDGARSRIADGEISVIIKAGRQEISLKSREPEGKKPKTLWSESKYSATSHGTKLLLDMLGSGLHFSYPKSIHLTIDAIKYWAQASDYILDFFAGSGTTGHAVINLNREDEGNRKFILVEIGAYFNTVLKPRIAKVLYSPEWKDGKAAVHGKGSSALVKYFSLESYEDALNNLPAPAGGLLAGVDSATRDAMLTYSLDLEMGPNLLNLEAFRDPWGYTINAQPAGEAEIKPCAVDLVETFNYLLGLKVKVYGPLERYSADFERAEHPDGLGRMKVTGRLRRDPAGVFIFQRVEGELLDGTRVLVVWRKLTDDAEKDAAALDAWMARHREETTERSEYREYQQIYINGPVTLAQPTAEIRTVLPIEQTFKDCMFCETNGVQHG